MLSILLLFLKLLGLNKLDSLKFEYTISQVGGGYFHWYKYSNGILECYGSYLNSNLNNLKMRFPYKFVDLYYSVQFQAYLKASVIDELVAPANKTIESVDINFGGESCDRFDVHIIGRWK